MPKPGEIRYYRCGLTADWWWTRNKLVLVVKITKNTIAKTFWTDLDLMG